MSYPPVLNNLNILKSDQIRKNKIALLQYSTKAATASQTLEN